MGLTLDQKFDRLHKAENDVRAARADLVDSSTGEAVLPGEPVFDASTKQVYMNENGKLAWSKPRVVQATRTTS